MKRNLGRVVAVLTFLATVLCANEPYRWSVEISKSEAYLHEAVHLVYQCRFDNEGMRYNIEFHPPEITENYRLLSLKEQERIENGKRVNRYEFVLFPMKPGTLELEYEALMRRTTEGAIENAIIGRDNVEDYEFSDTIANLPAVALNVKGQSAPLYGDIHMKMELKKESVEAYEPVQVKVTIEGTGNLDEIDPFELKREGVNVFADEPERDYRLTPEGFQGRIVQRFALSSGERFTVPPLELSCFNSQKQRVELLSTGERGVEVKAAYKAEELLDEVEEEPTVFSWNWLNYAMTFLCGMLAGVFLVKRLGLRKANRAPGTLGEKIEAAKSEKELLLLLALDGRQRFKSLVEAAERERWALAKIKKEALGLI